MNIEITESQGIYFKSSENQFISSVLKLVAINCISDILLSDFYLLAVHTK